MADSSDSYRNALVHLPAHTSAHMHTHARARTHTHARTRTHAHTHARTHTHTHARTRARTHARTHERAHRHTHTHERAHRHTRKHTPYRSGHLSCLLHAHTFCHLVLSMNMLKHVVVCRGRNSQAFSVGMYQIRARWRSLPRYTVATDNDLKSDSSPYTHVVCIKDERDDCERNDRYDQQDITLQRNKIIVTIVEEVIDDGKTWEWERMNGYGWDTRGGSCGGLGKKWKGRGEGKCEGGEGASSSFVYHRIRSDR